MGQAIHNLGEQRVIEKLKELHPQQLDEVFRFIDCIVRRDHEKTNNDRACDVRRSIMELRGRGKGEALVERLLKSRREDKKLDERR